MVRTDSFINPGELGMSPAHHGTVKLCIIRRGLIRGGGLELGLFIWIGSPSDYDW